jgi:hypothetical protein
MRNAGVEGDRGHLGEVLLETIALSNSVERKFLFLETPADRRRRPSSIFYKFYNY